MKKPFALVLLAFVATLACGNSSVFRSRPIPTPSMSAPIGIPLPGLSSPNSCTSESLKIAVLGPPSAGAGNAYQELGLTNIVPTTCIVLGFVNLVLLDGLSRPIPTYLVQDKAQFFPWARPSLISLKEGQAAPFWIHWEDIPTGGETNCPVSAQVLILPPGQTRFLPPITFIAMACNHGELDVSPLTPPGTSGP